MLFHELMQMDAFGESEILVDNVDMNHPVKAVYVMEDWHLPEHIDQGGVFFTSGAAMCSQAENQNELLQNIEQLMEDLWARHAAGLILEVGPFLKKVPDEVIEYARKKRLPLLTLPYEMAVYQVIPQIYLALFEEKNKRSEEKLFMRELLYGNEERAIFQLGNFNYRSDRQHIVIFFGFDKEGYDEKMIQEMAAALPINLSLTLFSVVYPDKDGVVVILELSQKEPIKDIVNRFLSAVQHDMGERMKGNTISAGVSSTFYNPERMRACVDEAKKALQLLRGYQICHSARYFEEIGIYRFFFELENDVQLEDFVTEILGPLINYDQENKSDYLDTLEAYLDFGCNIGETAKYMYMHRNTIKYRITRIEEILDVDLSNVGIQFNLRFAFKIRKYFRKSNIK